RRRAPRTLAARRVVDHPGARGARRLPHRRLPPRRADRRGRLVDPVAAPARHLRTVARVVGWAFGGLALVVVLFALAGWIGSSIPRNGDWREPAEGVEIMVGTNGVHTELVLPLITREKDWRPVFPAADLPVPDRPYT